MFLVQLALGSTYTTTNVTTAIFFLAMGLYFEASAHNFRNIFAEIGETTKNSAHDFRLEAKGALIKAVNFHIYIKRY